MAEQSKYTLISIADLKAIIRGGNRYEGLVDGVGYVYWRTQEIHFIQTNQDKLFALPIYQQIINPWFGFDRAKKVYTKIQYTLYVLSREDLMKKNQDMYWFYYGPIIEMEKVMKAFARDAIRVERPVILADIPHKQSYDTDVSAARRAWGAVDTATDVADELGLLSKPVSKYLSIGKTAINVIDNVNNGKYIDAAGNVIMSFANCSIGLYIDIGVAIYNTDLMQRRMATDYARTYKEIEKQIRNEGRSKNPNYDKIRRLEKAQQVALDNFKNCMDNLGIKYNK